MSADCKARYLHAVDLLDAEQFEDCIDVAKQNLLDPTLPLYGRIKNLVIIARATDDWYRGERYRRKAEERYCTSTRLAPDNQVHQRVLRDLRESLDELARHLEEDKPEEVDEDLLYQCSDDADEEDSTEGWATPDDEDESTQAAAPVCHLQNASVLASVVDSGMPSTTPPAGHATTIVEKETMDHPSKPHGAEDDTSLLESGLLRYEGYSQTSDAEANREAHANDPHSKHRCANCGRQFDSGSELSQHEVVAHQCAKCDSRFTSPTQLAQHERDRHPAIDCEECGMQVDSTEILITHKQLHHPASDVQGLTHQLETLRLARHSANEATSTLLEAQKAHEQRERKTVETYKAREEASAKAHEARMAEYRALEVGALRVERDCLDARMRSIDDKAAALGAEKDDVEARMRFIDDELAKAH